MNAKKHFRVKNSFLFTMIGMVIEFADIEFGFQKGSLLKSLSSGLYWQVQYRIIEFGTDIKFDGETEMNMHLNFRSDNLIEEINSFLYLISPIGHFTKPQRDDLLVFHKTLAFTPLKILEDYEDYVLLDGNAMMSKKNILKNKQIQVGDYVRYCEHGFHDLVDEKGNFIYRNVT